MPAGAMTTCCPISRRRRTRRAAPINITAAAARCRCRTGAMPIRCRRLSSTAAVETGIPYNPDFNGATQEGAGFFQTTTRNGRRASTRGGLSASRAAPRQSASRDRGAGAALAVRGPPRGRRRIQAERPIVRRARARKEILLSSGAYQLAATAAALRRRPRRTAAASTASMSCSMRRASATICRTTCRSAS